MDLPLEVAKNCHSVGIWGISVKEMKVPHSVVKSFHLGIAATITTHSVSCGGDSEPYSNKIYILKGKVSEKKASVDILLLNSQVSFPFAPDGRLCQEQGFTRTHRALVGKPTALVRGALQPCMAAHWGVVPFGNLSPKLCGAPRPSTPS